MNLTLGIVILVLVLYVLYIWGGGPEDQE